MSYLLYVAASLANGMLTYPFETEALGQHNEALHVLRHFNSVARVVSKRHTNQWTEQYCAVPLSYCFIHYSYDGYSGRFR